MAYDIVSLLPAFCAAFLGQSQFESGGLAFKQTLEVRSFDYSIESLHALDRYLEVLRKGRAAIPEQTYTNTVLAAGCYLGETIRRNATRKYVWTNYNDYFPKHQALMKMIPEGLGSSAVLVTEGGGMTMPINKIIRYIEEGPENNTHFYARAEVGK
jgi:hypothetical protein